MKFSKLEKDVSEIATHSSVNSSVSSDKHFRTIPPPQCSQSPATDQCLSKNIRDVNDNNSKKFRASTSASQSTKKTVQQCKNHFPKSLSNKSSKIKNQTLPLCSSFVKLKTSKKLQHYVEEAMESEALNYESDNSCDDVNLLESK